MTTEGLFTEPAGPPTMADQLACVRREIAMRRNVYPKWVESGRLKAEEATREQARMQAVHDSLERLAALDEAAARAAEPTTAYVLGYAFTHAGQVMMMRKTADMPSGEGLNGIGGRIQPGETPGEAMDREWREETGRHEPAPPYRFRRVGEFHGRGFRVHVFAAGPLDSWPPLHGEGEPEPGLITADLHAMLRRSPTAHYGVGLATAMPLCPWVPTTLALATLEALPPEGREPRLECR